MNEILKKSAAEQSKALRNKEISAVELLEATFERINEVEDKVEAFNSLTKDIAMETAKKVDEKIAKGEELPLLAGVPLALKDNMNLIGSKTTASSKILENFVSPYNATVTEKLLNNLVPIVGKANLDEFAMGSSTENSAFKKTKNPWDLNKVPGGSSGGSAASVAACEATLSLGSDTGGSIRLPGSFCGIVGMKPTYGRVSRYGLIAFASSLDQIGPFARTIEDAAMLLEVISGLDPMTLGMSVDANVLIYERINEEIHNGNTPQASIHAGFEKAFLTIFDSNLTTLIAALMLYAFGSGPVRGFAVTLSLGIITSMFTAITITRAIINFSYGGRKLQKLPL